MTKVHHEVNVRAGKGYLILCVGHEGHDEAVGTMAVAPGATSLVRSEGEVAALAPSEGPVALLAQMTLSHQEWAGFLEAARRRFPDLWTPGRSDLCFATTNRQTALRTIAAKADATVIIGSAKSSNTLALEKEARAAGCPRVYRVDTADELPDDLEGVIGVTAGASAPEELVQEVVDRLAPADGVELVSVTEEDEYFPPPRELRELVSAVGRGATGSRDAPDRSASPLEDDRRVAASDVIGALMSGSSGLRGGQSQEDAAAGKEPPHR